MGLSKTYNIKGMHCASCVSLIQNKVTKIPGVDTASVSLASEKATITFTNKLVTLDTLNSTITPFGYSLEDTTKNVSEKSTQSTIHSDNDQKNNISEKNMGFEMKIIIPMIIFSFTMMFWEALEDYRLIPAMSENTYEVTHHLMPIFASFVLFGIGRRYIRATWIFFKTGIASMDTLVGISTIVAFLYSFAVTAFEGPLSRYIDVSSNFYDVVIVVIGLIAFGQFLETKAKRKTNEALLKLAELSSKSALIERDGHEIEIPIEQVRIGDIVIIKPNERVPIDGKIINGSSSLDESNLTGESIPVDKTNGDMVFAGTQNFQGIIKIKVEKDTNDTTLAHIISIVENAQSSKAPIEKTADKISGIFVYVVIILALITFISWLIFGPQSLGFTKAFALALSSTMAVLVIACPCSLGLATPTAVITGVGTGARRGILIKNAESLEKLSKVQAIVFDKTGTLTENKLSVKGIFCQDNNHTCSEEDKQLKQSIVYSMAKSSNHPISQSLASWFKAANVQELPLKNITEVAGKGITALYKETQYYLGSNTYMAEVLGINLEKVKSNFNDTHFKSGREIYLSDAKNILSLIKIHDTIKKTSKDEISKLKKLGLTIIMATGDNKKTGESVAKELGIDEIFTDVKPNDKLSIISNLQKKGIKVAMIGDGVNDSPALTQADVAISMSNGSDIAIESSDIVLLNGDIGKVAEAINLARKTNRTIWQNLIWSFGYNSLGIPIAAGILYPFFGWTLSPALAGAIMAFESITVVTNSLRLKNATL
jgi:Cu+-exporting ATPase